MLIPQEGEGSKEHRLLTAWNLLSHTFQIAAQSLLNHFTMNLD